MSRIELTGAMVGSPVLGSHHGVPGISTGPEGACPAEP